VIPLTDRYSEHGVMSICGLLLGNTVVM